MNEIDIANRALAKIHETIPMTSDDGTIASSTTAGVAADAVRRFYSASRQQILRLATWTCIMKRIVLAIDGWEADTAWAAGDIIIVGQDVFICDTAGTSGSEEPTWSEDGTTTDGTAEWSLYYTTAQVQCSRNRTGYLYTSPLPSDYINQVEVVDLYGKRIDCLSEGGHIFTDYPAPVLVYIPDETDINRWDTLLQEAVVLQLASAIAYPVRGSHEDEIAFAQGAFQLASQAAGLSDRERLQAPLPVEEWFPGLFDRPKASR